MGGESLEGLAMNAPRVTISSLSPLGRELRKLRVDRSMRLFDVAQRLGVTPSFVSAIEVGRKTPPDYFVDLLATKLTLTDAEVRRLNRAADISRDSVVIEAESEAARILAGTLARKINSLTLEKIGKILKFLEYSTRHEPERYRRDRFVQRRSQTEVINVGKTARKMFGYVPDQRMHIVELIELDLPKLLPELCFQVIQDDDMETDVLGLARLWPPEILVAESIYLDAISGKGHARWILAHELGHIWLLHGKDSLRGPQDSNVRIPSLWSAEFQADEFAAEFLMPAEICRDITPLEISRRFGVSESLAQRRSAFLRRN
jgi:transcriptional regulator with XRE-family HTH domain